MTDYVSVLLAIRPGSRWNLNGNTYEGLVWLDEDEPPTKEELNAAWPQVQRNLAWVEIRAERDRLLTASDWTQIADAPVDSAAWAVYRQALRDIPQEFASPEDVVWPETP